jgi:hypothetical protein
MAADFELALFDEELLEVRNLPEAVRWELERDLSVPLGLFAVMHPISKPNEQYKARLRWRSLLTAPSLKFVDLTSGAENIPSAWPLCFGFRPSSLDACLPWTDEGHALHPEWASSTKNSFPKVDDAPLQFALLNIQFSLDRTYTGRGSA